MYSCDTIWNDADPGQMATLPPSQLHREIDLAILEADQAGFYPTILSAITLQLTMHDLGYVRTHIVLPSTIYGIAKGRLYDLGISNPQSIQIPGMIYVSLARGQGGMIGDGKNLWPNVEIDDLGDLYIALFDAVLNNSDTGHGLDGYYFGENGEHSLYDIGKSIAQALFDLGKGQSPEPTPFTEEDIRKYFGGSKYLGSNSRCRGNHSRAIGWKPKKTTEDLLASIRPEVETLIKLGKSYNAKKNQSLKIADDA
ncbi:hypothetical protein HGRIS_003765 [Hohenbuehelia grisea]|uniref:Uncharacterized protein n=1 Tax=Hohenbuehelia grisea TaxID=104357 RepID=A0ABR3JI56_9AGAR